MASGLKLYEVRDLSATIIVGILTSLALYILMGRIPTVPVAKTYLQILTAIFYICLGMLPVFIYRSKSNWGIIAGTFLLTFGIGTTAVFLLREYKIVSLLPFSGIALTTLVIAIAGTGIVKTSRQIVYKLTGMLVSVLYAFSGIFVLALVVKSRNLQFVVLFLLCTGVFVVTAVLLRREIAEATDL